MSVGVPQPGQVVRVRSRQYLVEEVVLPPNPADQTLVRLSCLDDDAQGQELEALWEKEVDARVVSDEAWRAVGNKGLDEPRLFAAWLTTPSAGTALDRPSALPVAVAGGPGWWQTARIDLGRAVWGGEVAADRLTGRLKPGRQTLYVWGKPDDIILANRLRPDDKGEVEIPEAFWTLGEGPGTGPEDVAPALLVYADLMATGDPRNVEAARLVRRRHLGGVLGPA